MATSELRKEWQDFKKRYPDFEKAKGAKANIGPQLDKLVKEMSECSANLKKVKSDAEEVVKLLTSLVAAVRTQHPIANTLEKQGGKNKGILKELENMIKVLEGAEKNAQGMVDRLKQVIPSAGA